MFLINAFHLFGTVEKETRLSGSNKSYSSKVISLDGQWLLAIDPENVGRDQQWGNEPVSGAKETKVPWVIQEAFPPMERVPRLHQWRHRQHGRSRTSE